MAALKNNGFELMRAERIKTDPLREGDDPDLEITFREIYSLRSNGAIMLKRDHRFADDPIGQWRIGAWKREKKIQARQWRKLDHRSWLKRQQELLISHGFEITAEASEVELTACDHRCKIKQDQRRASWR